MKKIVALALCLIMALSLATVAFAAVTFGDCYKWDDTEKDWVKQPAATVISYTSATETKNEKGVVTGGTVAYYTIAGTKYAETVSGKETVRLVVDGVQKYLVETTETDYTLVGSKVTSSKKCGEVQTNAANTKLYVSSNETTAKYYVADNAGTTKMLVGGVVVKVKDATKGAANDYVVNPHEWDVTYTKDSDDVISGTAVCELCGKKATVTSKVALIPTGATIEDITDVVAGAYLYYDATAAAGTTTGVTSAKTFDAGVALYAGMALMSVAGSAVVIGKKKEF